MRSGLLRKNLVLEVLLMTILLCSFSAVSEELDVIPGGTILGDLEVSDSVSPFAFIQTHSIPVQEKEYSSDKFGLTIWRPDIGNHPAGLKCYAMWDKDTGKLSLLLNGTDRDLFLKSMTIAEENTRPNILKNPDINMQLYTYLENTLKNVSTSETLIRSLNPYETLLKQAPQFNSTLTDKIFKFDYYVAGSEGDPLLDPISHNWNCTNNGKISNGKISDSIKIIPTGLEGYYLNGYIFNWIGDISRIYLNDRPWVSGPVSGPMYVFREYNTLPLPADIKISLERENKTAYARIGMAIMADDVDITRYREAECEGKPRTNTTTSLTPYEIDLNKVDHIAWPPLRISDSKPENPNVCLDENGLVQFSWTTNLESNSTVMIREEGKSEFEPANKSAKNVREHNLSCDLNIGKTYFYYVTSFASFGRQAASKPTELKIGNCSIIWCKPYEFTILRDYDQDLTLCITNRDSISHNISVSSSNPYGDLRIGFLDENISIGPNERKEIILKVHAQDANRTDYDVDVKLTEMERNQTDEARVKIHIDSKIDFAMTELQQTNDCSEIVKTIRITNTGRDPLTDLMVRADNNCSVNLQPRLNHGYLAPGEHVDFKAIALYSGPKSISSVITAKAHNVKRTLNISFSCNGRSKPIKVTLDHPQLTVETDDWYCTNNPDLNLSFSLLPGFDASDVISAKMLMDFNCHPGYVCMPHYLQITLNGNKTLYENPDFIPGGIVDLSSRMKAGDLKYSDPLNGSCGINEIIIKSIHNPAHYVVTGKVKIILCLKKLDMWVCAQSEIEGKKKLLSCIPGIAPVYSNLSVDIGTPWPGQNSSPKDMLPINASVNGTEGSFSGSQKGADVRAFFDSNETAGLPVEGIELFDDGNHSDSSSNDGIYANNWIVPANAKGIINITVRAKTCLSEAENWTWIKIIPPDVDLVISRINIMKSTEAPGKVSIDVEVSNLGREKANPSNTSLQIGNITKGLKPVGYLNASENFSVEWDLSESELCGNAIVTFADALEEVDETDETNNSLNESYCQGCPGNRTPPAKICTQIVPPINNIGDIGPYYPIKKEISASAAYDLMFYDSQNQPLYYWIENGSENGKNVTVWINVPFADLNGNSYITMTNSTTGASQYQDPEKVFSFFDDFATCQDGCSDAVGTMGRENCVNLDKWNWSELGEGGKLVCENDGARISADSEAIFEASLQSKQRFSAGSSLMFRMNISSDYSGASKYMGLMDDQMPSIFWRTMDNGKIQICKNIWPSNNNSCWESRPYYSGYKRFEIDWLNSKITTQMDDDEKDELSISPALQGRSLPIMFKIKTNYPYMDSYMSLDWIAVRKLVDPEPRVELRFSMT